MTSVILYQKFSGNNTQDMRHQKNDKTSNQNFLLFVKMTEKTKHRKEKIFSRNIHICIVKKYLYMYLYLYIYISYIHIYIIC